LIRADAGQAAVVPAAAGTPRIFHGRGAGDSSPLVAPRDIDRAFRRAATMRRVVDFLRKTALSIADASAHRPVAIWNSRLADVNKAGRGMSQLVASMATTRSV
jgi:hypothetical protein